MYYPDDKKDRGVNNEKGGYIDLSHCSLTKVDGKVGHEMRRVGA